MIALKNILVPTDFSECANAAVKYGRELAEHFGARLHLLHVVHDPSRYASGVESVPLTGYDFVHRWQRTALETLRTSAPKGARPVKTMACAIGVPVDEIFRYAREHEIDLIVMGTHGRGAVAHVLLGSVAERVARKAPCPVLTVHHRQHEFIQEPVATAEAVASG